MELNFVCNNSSIALKQFKLVTKSFNIPKSQTLSDLIVIILLCCKLSQTSVQAAENLIKSHEAFISTMDANDEKIDQVVHLAEQLLSENHYDKDKIHKKNETIKER